MVVLISFPFSSPSHRPQQFIPKRKWPNRLPGGKKEKSVLHLGIFTVLRSLRHSLEQLKAKHITTSIACTRKAAKRRHWSTRRSAFKGRGDAEILQWYYTPHASKGSLDEAGALQTGGYHREWAELKQPEYRQSSFHCTLGPETEGCWVGVSCHYRYAITTRMISSRLGGSAKPFQYFINWLWGAMSHDSFHKLQPLKTKDSPKRNWPRPFCL